MGTIRIVPRGCQATQTEPNSWHSETRKGVAFRTQISRLEQPVLAELLLDVEQPDLAVGRSVPVRIRVGVGRWYVGDAGGGHRVAPVDGRQPGSPTSRGCGDTPGQVTGHVEPAIGGVIVVIHAKASADDPCTIRRKGNAQARREVAVRGLHERVGKIAVGALRPRIDGGAAGGGPSGRSLPDTGQVQVPWRRKKGHRL